MEADLQNELGLYRTLWSFLGNTAEGYYFFADLVTRRICFSGFLGDLYDISQDAHGCCSIEDWVKIVYAPDVPKLKEFFRLTKEDLLLTHDLQYRLMRKNGDVVWITSRSSCRLDEFGHSHWIAGHISGNKNGRQIDYYAGSFHMEGLKEEISLTLSSGADGFLLVVGVDDLKSINLKQGRYAGDAVLKNVAEALEDVTYGTRPLYRVNGDCFVVLLPHRNRDDISSVFSQMQKRMDGQCTLSGGCVAFREYPVTDPTALYQYAESALDYAKVHGKNRLWFFSAEDYERQIVTLELKEDLERSIQSGFSGFSLVYQPQVHSLTYSLYGAECLLRYTSPRRGPVSPTEFVPILEQTKLICPIGLWVLETALTQCRHWRKKIPDFHISINMSYTQLLENSIVSDVLQVLKRSGLPGNALTIELTESMQLMDYPHINSIFRQWKDHGIEISVDDFGTGYSSLSRLKEMEIDEIKIDRCFVNNIQHSAYNYRLLSNMLELADSCQIRVCCEGIETEDELHTLEELHPDLLQGFLFARPCTVSELEALYLDPTSTAFSTRTAAEQNYRKDRPSSNHPPLIDGTEQEFSNLVLAAENDIFYVSDMDTYELYYLNPAGQRLFGIQHYRGRKCYKALQGLDAPCPFCTNDKLNQDSFYIWENENEYCGRHFLLKDKIIPYQGKRLRLEVASDITKREVVSQSTREQLEFAKRIVGYTKTLTEFSDFNEAVEQVLAAVGEFYQADRAYLFEPCPAKAGCWNNTFEWCMEHVTPQMEHLQGIPEKVLKRWISHFDLEQSVIIYNLDTIKDTSPDEWEVLHFQDIQRLIAVPLRDGDKTIGFIGVDNPRYAIHDDTQVQVLANFLVDRIRRDRNEARYQAMLRSKKYDIMDSLNVGLWIIRISPDRSYCEMLANDTMFRVLGVENIPTPEECYQFWYTRINEGYYHYVDESVDRMIQTYHTIQLEYTWRHPQKGEVLVRCTGLRMPDEDGMICLKGYHRIISDIDRPQFLPEIYARDIFEYNETTHSIFFHTKRSLMMGDSTHQSGFPQCWIQDGTVHPHFADEFRSSFSRLRIKDKRKQLELLLRSKSGTYEWFKLTLQHLSKEQKDLDTIIVIVEPIGSTRVLELEFMRVHRFYQALLSDTIAYAEVDLESGQLMSVGGVWRPYHQDYRTTSRHFISVLQDKLAAYLPKEQYSILDSYLDASTWTERLSQGRTSDRLRYRRPVSGSLHWVELNICLFQEETTKNVYALLYLKDINSEMEREVAQEEAARRDPLTHTYNRAAFERVVSGSMTNSCKDTCGILMLLDIDNFKRINDQRGHLEGDKALKLVAKTLLSTFRQEDTVGRLGGDEFLVYIQGDLPRPIVEKRLKKLLDDLRAIPENSLTGSIGLTYVRNDSTSYLDYLHHADIALYHSKHSGKDCFCFYEDLAANRGPACSP